MQRPDRVPDRVPVPVRGFQGFLKVPEGSVAEVLGVALARLDTALPDSSAESQVGFSFVPQGSDV